MKVNYSSLPITNKEYTAKYILSLPPNRLRAELSKLCSITPDMAGKIEAEIGFIPKWSRMNTYQYFLVAIAWAKLENSKSGYDSLFAVISMMDISKTINSIIEQEKK